MSTDINLRRVALIWIAIAGAFYGYDILRDTGAALTAAGRPIGDDYVNYWSGAVLAWQGRAAEVYNYPLYHAFQQGIVGSDLGSYTYSYPPMLLILTAPLAALPYVPGLAAWLIASFIAFWRALSLALPGRDGLLLALATPAVFVNAYGGQNGTWTAALLGGGLSLIERRPFIAGALFGLLIYKPHLGLLIPVALLAGRQWRAIAGACVSAGVLLAVTLAVFGAELWRDYFQFGTLLRLTILEQGAGGWNRLVSVFAMARTFGADVAMAYAMQAVIGLIAAVVVAIAWLRDAPAPVRYASLVLGALFATPYLIDYDFVVCAFVAVWLLRPESLAHHTERAATIASGLILTVPLFSSMLTNMTGFVLAPLFLVTASVLVMRAVLAERSVAPAAALR